MTAPNVAEAGVCLNYGAAWDAPPDWLNLDASPVILFERLPLVGRLYTKNKTRFPDNVYYGDIVKGLKLADASADLAFSSHVLEHLAREEAEVAVAETFRVLRPGGLFRVIVPDLESAVRRYVHDLDNGVSDANDQLLRRIILGRERRQRGLASVLRLMFSNVSHQWMWDAPSLTALLTRHGFVDIRQATFGDSIDPRFLSVEREARFFEAVALEARKPQGA